MKILKLQRTLKEGFSNFMRNGWLSVATITVISISLLIIGFTIAIGFTAKSVLKNMEDKVNVSVYFNPSVTENRILEIKKEIEGKYLEIKSVEYVSKDQAKDDLVAMDPSIQKAIDEVGENPLLSSLAIKANDATQYEVIAKTFQDKFGDEVSRVNYDKNKGLIERITKIIRTAEKGGMVLGILFVLLSVLITFNTVRITIYAHRQEFEVMRLVGASNLYVEMPFIFEGILYGISASLVSFSLLALSFWYFSSLNSSFFAMTGLNAGAMGIIFLVMLLLGVFLGVISSSIAIQRYLKK
jgi:cell division transport system permease protein